MTIIEGRTIYRGVAKGEALVTKDTIPGWGGIDPDTGIVIDKFHELYGESIKDKILIFRGARGSSGWANTFHIARLKGNVPKGIIFTELTSKLCLGILVMKRPAIITSEKEIFNLIKNGDEVTIDGTNGKILLGSK